MSDGMTVTEQRVPSRVVEVSSLELMLGNSSLTPSRSTCGPFRTILELTLLLQ